MNINDKIKSAFKPYINYGIMKNENEKYLKMGYRSVIVAVFPYFYNENTKLFSRYCSIPDYHTVVKKEFEDILKDVTHDFKIMVDVSPFKEKTVAQNLGLGEIGENNLLLTKEYGSFVFIGEALLKEELEPLSQNKQKICTHCGQCVKKCPTNALSGGFCRGKCLSYLSQKKVLNEEEEKLLKNAVAIFGCDICQLACPVNKNAMQTPIESFKRPVLDLSEETVLFINEDEFQKRYSGFAFAYKGSEILKRNVRIINGTKI